MKRSAVFIMFLSVLVFFSSCWRSDLSVHSVGDELIFDVLRDGLELPEITAQEVRLEYFGGVGSFTITNAEGETLRVNGMQFSGDMEILDSGFNMPAPHWVALPASSSFTIVLDEPSSSESAELLIYGPAPAGREFFGGAKGKGFSTIVVNTLGTEVQGEDMDCTIYTSRECNQRWNISLVAEDAYYMSIFCNPGSAEAILGTDGTNPYAQAQYGNSQHAMQTYPMTDGQPLKLTNLQAEDIALIQAVPYED